jgi:hypothetical protein
MENKILFSVFHAKQKIDSYCLQRWEEKWKMQSDFIKIVYANFINQ